VKVKVFEAVNEIRLIQNTA